MPDSANLAAGQFDLSAFQRDLLIGRRIQHQRVADFKIEHAPERLRQLIQVRFMLEPENARLAAENASAAQMTPRMMTGAFMRTKGQGLVGFSGSRPFSSQTGCRWIPV